MTSEEYNVLRKLPTWRYNVIVQSPTALRLNRIHPLKQRLVDAICKEAKNHKVVKRIIIFGSSIRWDAHQWSDLDICIDWYGDVRDDNFVDVKEVSEFKNRISILSEGNADIIDYQFLNETVVADAVEKGVCVYE